MAVLDFPATPAPGDKYPIPAISGIPQYVWDGEKWTTLGGAVGLDVLHVRRAGDTMTGLLELSGAPLIDYHAATKRYVDDLEVLVAAALGDKVDAAGDTMSGALHLPLAAPTANTEAANKKYVDDRFGAVPAVLAAATAAEYRAGAVSGKYLDPATVFAAAAQVILTDAATVTPDFSTGFDFAWTLGATGRTLANPTNIKVGQKGVIALGQGIAGATITTWGNFWKFSGGTKPTLTATAGAIDILSYVVINASYIACSFSADFK